MFQLPMFQIYYFLSANEHTSFRNIGKKQKKTPTKIVGVPLLILKKLIIMKTFFLNLSSLEL